MSRSSDRGGADGSTVLRYALYYRAVATVSFLVGMGIALAGVWLGLGDAVSVALDSFLQEGVMGRAMGAANLPLTLGLGVVGVLVWQIGKTAAFYWTFTAALTEGDAGPAGSDPGQPRAEAGPPDTPTEATHDGGTAAPAPQGESTAPAGPAAGSETAGDGSADPLAGGTEATGGGRPDDGGSPE